MSAWRRVIILTISLVILGIGLLAYRNLVAFDPSSAYPGRAEINGPLDLELVAFPPVASPGDDISLQIHLTNRTEFFEEPIIVLQLPVGLQPNTQALPAGVTVNLQTRALTWLPSKTAPGSENVLTISARLETVDINSPEQAIGVSMRSGDRVQEAEAAVWLGISPQVSAVLAPAQVSVGLPFQLQADLAGSGPFKQTWDLGDGRRVALNNPVILFPAPGIYEITLIVDNPLASISAKKSITVVPHPAAQFSPDDALPGIDQQISFQNRSGGQPPLQFSWDFGDGTISTIQNPTHAYTEAGSYQVHLVVENEFGSSEAFWSIVVGLPPAVEMSLAESVPMGAPVMGFAQGDATVMAYRWDMGDGRTYNQAQIDHIYRQTGDFYVTVTANNEFGSTEQGQWLHVDPGQLALYLPLVLQTATAPNLSMNNGQDAQLPYLDELKAPFVMTPMSLPETTTQAEALFIYINEARKQFDLAPLQYVYELSVAAQAHTGDMAQYKYTGHSGSDGSYPLERLVRSNYPHGYAGEATAWGFENAYEAVEFWVNSPPHRRIILNPFATDVGVAYTVNFEAPNVWYWTAEFGNQFAGAVSPFIRLQEPEAGLESLNTSPLRVSWNWPLPLAEDQRFMVYWSAGGIVQAVGTVSQPEIGSRYAMEITDLAGLLGEGDFTWHVSLENGSGAELAASEVRPLTILRDPDLPTPEPEPTVVPLISPTATPLPTMTPAPAPPTETPIPTGQPLPPIVTSTPVN